MATSALVSLPLLASLDIALLSTQLLQWLPITATAAAFVLCYKLIPHRPVRFRHALIGGVTAALAFEAAKRLFALYVTQFPTQQAVYGAFAAVPLFLLWVYVSWVIVLLGAQLTHSLAVAPGPRRIPRGDWRASELYCGFRLLHQLHAAQHSGKTLSDERLRLLEPDLDHALVDDVLLRLEQVNWIARDTRYDWLLLRDLDDLTLGDLARITPPDDTLGRCEPARLAAEDGHLHALLLEYAAQSAAVLSRPLASLLAADEPADDPARARLRQAG